MEATRHSIQTEHAITYIPILSHSELNDSEKIIYGHISNLCKDTGYCYATNRYLTELTGKSLATVKRAIKKLAELDFIEINHIQKKQHDERRISLKHSSQANEPAGGSKVSYPQPKNELPNSSKTSHRTINENYINKITTTQTVSQPANMRVNSSSSFKCKTKLNKLENLPISDAQKQVIYRDFTENQILQGLEWLDSVDARHNVAAALYDAIKNGYQPKLNPEKIADEHRQYAQTKLGKYEEQTLRGYKISLCRRYVEFSTPTGRNYCFEYSYPSFKYELNNFCARLGLRVA